MIEREILADIGQYETRVIFHMTKRELLGVVIAVGCIAPMWFVFHSLQDPVDLTIEAEAGFAAIFGLPGIAYGFLKPCGMPFEVFIKDYFKYYFLPPVFRRYKTINTFNEAFDIEDEQEKPMSRKELKKERKAIAKLGDEYSIIP